MVFWTVFFNSIFFDTLNSVLKFLFLIINGYVYVCIYIYVFMHIYVCVYVYVFVNVYIFRCSQWPEYLKGHID